MRIQRLTALLLSSALAACAAPRLKVGDQPGGEVVEVTGEAMIDNGDLPGAKKRSLVEAQKKAVEEVVGVHISAKTMVEKAITIDQTILAKSEGYISKYEVLKDWSEPPYYKTKIRAYVMYGKVSDDLKAAGLLNRPEVGHPRVAVLLTEKVNGVSPDFSADGAGRSVAQALLDAGYKVVDRSDAMAAKAETVSQQVDKGDVSGVASLGKQLDAEVLVFGNAYGQQLVSDMLGGLFSFRVTLNAQAFKAQTNEILLTVGKTSSGLDASKEAAANKALENVGKLAGSELADRLAQELAKKASVAVSVSGVPDLAKLKDFETQLTATLGVGDFYLRSFDGGKALLDVQVKDTGSQDLASAFERNTRVKAKITAVTHDTVELELIP
jgi:hypothetical protein